MKAIPCTIEVSTAEAEAYWHIAVPADATPEAALMFAALYLGRVEKIRFQDGMRQFIIRSQSAAMSEQTVTIDKTWLDALWCLFMDAHLNGWTDIAHLDQDFGNISITVAILPPEKGE